MNFLRQSTAVDIALGPFVDATDGVTAETALTISQADVRLKKNAGAWAQANDANAATHEENGWYEKALSATDTDTVGILIVAVNESGALPVWREFQVVEEAVYDRDYAASGTGIVGTAQTGDSFARLGAPAGASVSADIAAIEGQTDDIGAAGAGLTAVPWNAAWDAEVQSEVNDGLVAFFTSAAALVDLVWDEAQADHVAAGSFGETATEIAAILVDTAEIGAAGAGLTNINLPDQTMNITGNITGNLSGSVGSVTGAVGSVTGAVGSVTGAVGSVGAGGIAAATFAAGAIDAAALAASAGTEIAAAVLAAAAADPIDANVEQINTVTITGDGQVGTEFGV